MKNRLYNFKFNKERRRELRNNMTEAEMVLWEELRNKKLGYKFRRQFGIQAFIVDFCCPNIKLVIEVDGDIHLKKEILEKDNKKEQFLAGKGFKVLRYKNEDVLNRLDWVVGDIKGYLPPLGLPLEGGEVGSTPFLLR